MISSRYHILPGLGGASRSFVLHQRLWQHCQHQIMRIMLGQEKASLAKLRTVGTVEAFLLLSEWHPRAIHFPPEGDGWDSDLMLTPVEQRAITKPTLGQRWLEDVIEPAKRSDRMSWMLLSAGLALAHELDVFGEAEKSSPATTSSTVGFNRRVRVRRLLYLYINQLASRLGCTSIFPQHMRHPIQKIGGSGDEVWNSIILSWEKLSGLFKSFSETVFPSPATTKQLLYSGRYSGLIDHYQPLLEEWRQRHLDTRGKQWALVLLHYNILTRFLDNCDFFYDTLFIEYQYVRLYCNSLGMQAVCERALVEGCHDNNTNEGLATSLDGPDYAYTQEVILASCAVLQKIIKLAETDVLRFAPVRLFLHIITASMFLIKAISLGVRSSQLQSLLDILDQSVQALRTSALDDIHLAGRYATLLETHATGLRQRLTKISTRKNLVSRPGSVPPTAFGDSGHDFDLQGYSNGDSLFADMSADDLFSYIPFDPSMAPFDNGALEFLWDP